MIIFASRALSIESWAHCRYPSASSRATVWANSAVGCVDDSNAVRIVHMSTPWPPHERREPGFGMRILAFIGQMAVVPAPGRVDRIGAGAEPDAGNPSRQLAHFLPESVLRLDEWRQ